MPAFDDYTRFIGLPAYKRKEQEFLVREEVSKRYGTQSQR